MVTTSLPLDDERKMKLMIVGDWIYHFERCKIDLNQRRRMIIEITMQRLDRRRRVAKVVELEKAQEEKLRKSK